MARGARTRNAADNIPVAQPPVPADTKGNVTQEFGWGINWSYPGLGRQTFVRELDFGLALHKYQRMRRQDETIGAMFWVMTSTLVQFPWSFTPCVDGKAVSRDDPDFDKALEMAELMDGMLADMDHSWGDHLEEAATMAWAGFAPCEIVFKKRDGKGSRFDDGKWGLKGLPLRDQLTVWKFEYDPADNELLLLRQRTIDGKVADIPVWKLLHYRMSRVLNDPWGVSMLENCYRPWVLKNSIQDSEAVGIEREMCGLPTFRIPSSELLTANKTDAVGNATKEALAARQRIDAAITAVTKMRYNEAGGLVIPSDVYDDDQGKPSSIRKWDFELIKSTGQRAIDARTAARDYDIAIARTVLMQFLYLGSRAGGSFGLADNQSSLAIRSMYAFAEKIASEFNSKAIPLIWMMNALPDKFRPRLDHGHLHDESIEKFGQFLADMAQAQPLFEQDPALRDAVLDRAGLKGERDKIRNVAPKEPPAPSGALADPMAPPGGKPPSGFHTPPAPARPPSFARPPAPAAAKSARALHPNADGVSAKSPFLYDPNALGSLRPDQVPRFFGALTDPQRQPVKRVKLDGLVAMQDRIDPAKVRALQGGAAAGKKALVVRHNGTDYIADGHHRLSADWLNGAGEADVHYKDLTDVDQALKAEETDEEEAKRLGVKPNLAAADAGLKAP